MVADLVLPMTGFAGDENALKAAIALAEEWNAHLCVIEPFSFPTSAMTSWGFVPDMAAENIYDDLKKEAEDNASRLRERLGRESISWEVRIAEAFFVEPPRNIAFLSRYADIGILNAAPLESENGPELIGGYINAMLFESGRPVLIVPPRFSLSLPISRAAIAWKPTREATRALHDAMPLLCKAKVVDVLIIDPVIGEGRHGQEPGADIAVHLTRHGIEVNVVTHGRGRRTVAEALLHHAQEAGAQLLVAGGYGHSRLREWTFGGTTRELLQGARIPLLMSH